MVCSLHEHDIEQRETMSKNKRLIRVGDRFFAKTLAFGNRKEKNIQTNKKHYRRNPKHRNDDAH